MAKQKKQAKKEPKQNFFTTFSIDKYIPEKYQDIVMIIIPFILLYLFFSDVFFGSLTFISGDITTSMAMKNYLAYAREVGTQPLWDPYIFMGMPAYITSIDLRAFDLILYILHNIESIFQAFTNEQSAGPTFYFYILAITTYAFLRYKNLDRLTALFASIAVTFSTAMIIFIPIGHNTKMITLCMIPFLFLALERLQHKITFFDFLFLIIVIHIQLLSAHIQEIFYSYFAVLIYFIYFLIRYLLKKESKTIFNLLKVGVIFVFASLFAAGMSIDQYWAIYEYNPTSIRGTSSILEKANPQAKKSSGGLDYDYATNWSFSPGEMLTWIMPSFYGYGNSVYQGELTQNQPVEVNTYWGQMPFVDVPQYMGILIFVFGLMGMYFNRKNPFVQFLTILVVISVLISFGRTFPILYDLMFYHFPFFNKFRVPSMILNLVQIAFPILAAIGLYSIYKFKHGEVKINTSIINYFIYFFAALFLIFIVFSSPIKDWYIGLLRDSQKIHPQLYEYTFNMFYEDSLIAFAVAIAGLGLSLVYLRGKLNYQVLVIALIILTVFDLFRISSRGMRKYDETQLQKEFETPEWVKAIKQDTSIFRILNLKNDGSLGSLNHHSNYHVSFLLQDFYGYSGAKPRAYQDLIDVANLTNPTLWRMFNVKYIITEKPIPSEDFNVIYQDDKTTVHLNKLALPRAYFVQRFEKMPSLDFLNKIKNNEIEPAEVVQFSPETNLDFEKVDPPDTTAYVKITKYVFENIEMDVNASGNNLLFLGDTYYNIGWKAFIDGKETKIYRANHNGRAILVPPGKHKVEFRYEPLSYYLGKNISLGLNAVVLILLAFFGLKNLRKKNENS
ncbi:MAG: YfhO family protein [Ignavibacteria bacterium]